MPSNSKKEAELVDMIRAFLRQLMYSNDFSPMTLSTSIGGRCGAWTASLTARLIFGERLSWDENFQSASSVEGGPKSVVQVRDVTPMNADLCTATSLT